jgi:hypothetical protein
MSFCKPDPLAAEVENFLASIYMPKRSEIRTLCGYQLEHEFQYYNVTVDLGNGQVLLSKQVSKEDIMKDEVDRHHGMISTSMSRR